MPFNIPILLTWLRVLAIPVLLILFVLPREWIALSTINLWSTILFVLSALTDWLDGYLARRWHQVSAFGAFLDPVADKLLVTATLLILLNENRVGALIAFIIVGRELTIAALREWMAQAGASASVAVNWLGKVKTILQMIALPMLLFGTALGPIDIPTLGTYLLQVAALMTVVSMAYYLHKAKRQLWQS